MSIATPDFFIAVALLALLYHLYDAPRYRAWVLALGNAAFVGTFVLRGAQQLLLGWVLLSGYTMVVLARHKRVGRPGITLYIMALIAVLWVTRHPVLGEARLTASPPAVIPLLGYAYLMLKLVHMLVDAAQDRLVNVTPLTAFNYACGFFAWMSGPIQRFNDFAEQLRVDRTSLSTDAFLSALNRIVNGCLKAFVFGEWVVPVTVTEPLLTHPQAADFWLRLIGWCFGYYVYLYLNFSGYTDIMIGMAALFGVRLPENFNQPWRARNVVDFWQRWHMTLSAFLRDYVFHPVYLAMARLTVRMRWLAAALAYLFTFAVAALWHGMTVGFLLWGMLHGSAAFVNQLGNDVIMKKLPADLRTRYRRSGAIRLMAMVVCNVYVALTMLLFAHPLEELQRVWQNVWWRLP